MANQTYTKILHCFIICDALCDLVPFVQFKKREKHPWRSVNFSKVAGLKLKACNFTKSDTPPWVFFTFLNCAHGTKSRNAPHIISAIESTHHKMPKGNDFNKCFTGIYCKSLTSIKFCTN